MNRVPRILMTLVAAALTLPVEAARPNSPGSRSQSAGRIQSPNRMAAVGSARSADVQRRPTSLAAQAGRPIARPSTTADRRAGGSGERRSNGGPRQTARLEPRVPAPGSLTAVDAVLPNGRQPGPRIATPDHPDLSLPPRTVVDVGNPFGNGGGGNGGGGNGGGGNGGGGNGGGGHRPPPGRHPGHYGRGPTGWDLLAIGLATAAFSDRGVVSGGCYVNDCVTIGQPSCGVATTLVGAEPIVIEADLEAAVVVDDAVATSGDLPVNDADGTLAAAVPVELLPAKAAAVATGD